MKKWLTSAFLILALAGGVLAGMPLHSGNQNSQMKCCKRTKSAGQTPQMKMVRLCCVMNCSDTAPTPSGSTVKLPSAKVISDSIIKQIASLLIKKAKPVSTEHFSLERALLPRKIPPKFIQHHSILI